MGEQHERNEKLEHIVPEFVTWYCSSGDLQRASNVVAASRGITHYTSRHKMLTQLNEELLGQEKTQSFEAFSVYVEFKKIVHSWREGKNQVVRRLDEKLQELKAPECVRHLLGMPDGQPLSLVDEHGYSCYVKGRQLFSSAYLREKVDIEQQRFVVAVDTDTALATITFVTRDGFKWMLDASDPDRLVKVGVGGAASQQWRLQPADKGYFKISSQIGRILFLANYEYLI